MFLFIFDPKKKTHSMKYDYKGEKHINAPIQDLVFLLEKVDNKSIWLHNGLKVEIDPTVDFVDNNVLVRWCDVDEGFNDKVIYTSLKSFQKDFTLLNA